MTDGQDGWDGYLSPIHVKDEGVATCLRGHRDVLITTARNLEIPVDTSDCLASPFENIAPGDIPDDLIEADFKLDEYQRQGVAFWLKHGIGRLERSFRVGTPMARLFSIR